VKPNLEIDEAKVGLIVLHPAHQNHVPQGIELRPAQEEEGNQLCNFNYKGKN
jgi:hypothetical protein